MKKILILTLLTTSLFAGCEETEKTTPQQENVKEENNTVKEREYKEEVVQIGKPFDFRLETFPNQEDYIGVTFKNILFVKNLPMSEEEKGYADSENASGQQVRLLYEKINKNDFVIINWKVENKTNSDLRNYPNFIVENESGMQVQEVQHSEHLITYIEGILSPGGVNEGVFILKVPEDTVISKIYMLNGNYREYTDVHYIDLINVENIDTYTP
ncbi:hypothetical protein SAMN05518871_109144 [Psychrobacillus sp. OK028]|uniref:hypothetical protein n=1 Tax=Psychrobacillus sp. OK028 TaxID=1884359 RepID=UPI0008882756|nr:hypothetical protein [Psychrobacillus sp. OK028]SDO02856.1 hypothetical protein SAMN05518871_109144 [Psychrobacillus sp. OK028]